MSKQLGRKVQVYYAGELIAACREKTFDISNESIDISGGYSDGLNHFLDYAGRKTFAVSLAGLYYGKSLRDIARSDSLIKSISLVYEDKVIEGNFFMDSYSEGMPYNDATTFTVSLIADGNVTERDPICTEYRCELDGDLGFLSGTPVIAATGDVRYSPDGLYLATASGVFRRSDWGNVGLSMPSGVAKFAWSPDSTVLYVTTGSTPYFYAYLTATWTQVPGTPTLAASYAFGMDVSPDGGTVCVTSGSAPYYLLINTADWSTSTPYAVSNIRGRPKFSPDGTKLVLPGGTRSRILNTSDWSLFAEITTSQSYCAAFTPEMDYIVIGHGGSSQGYWALFTFPGLVEVTSKTAASATVVDCDINPCGNLLVLSNSSSSPYVDIMDTSTWQRITMPAGVGSTSCHFDPTGAELVASKTSGTTCIARYNTATTKICERQI